MQEDRSNVLFSLIKLILVLLVGFFIANFLAFLAVLPFVDYDLELITKLVQNPSDFPETRTALMVMQGVAALGIFVFTPIIYIRFVDNTLSFKYLFGNNALGGGLFLCSLTVLLAIVEMPLIAWLGEWNNGWIFPEVFESWARAQEEKMKALTIFLTTFHSFEQFLLGFVVIAIVPGMGEEFLFRGILQNKLKQLSGNAHLAIWLSAIIFSAIHFQFYGFAPRMLLGAVFGYLYHWSGNLAYAMVAHFVNNGFTIMMMYLYQQRQVEMDIDKEQVPIDMALLSLALSGVLMFLFYKIVYGKRLESSL
jgi:membrane protease YdiL (CAAX protease family)